MLMRAWPSSATQAGLSNCMMIKDYLRIIDDDGVLLLYFSKSVCLALFGQLLPGFIYGPTRDTKSIYFLYELTKTRKTRQ